MPRILSFVLLALAGCSSAPPPSPATPTSIPGPDAGPTLAPEPVAAAPATPTPATSATSPSKPEAQAEPIPIPPPPNGKEGDLDKNIIRRNVRRNLAAIRHCYERELLVDPKLSGTVVTQFQIMPSGKVSGVAASGMNTEVSDCVAGVVGKIEFPAPKYGGYVNVRYPFTFVPAGKANAVPPSSKNAGMGGMRSRRSGLPKVKAGKTAVKGSLSKDQIRGPVKRSLPRIRACYERELQSSPSLTGKVAIRFVIQPSGQVGKVEVTGMPKAVTDCVSKAIGDIKFPKPAGGGIVEVSYPMHFATDS